MADNVHTLLGCAGTRRVKQNKLNQAPHQKLKIARHKKLTRARLKKRKKGHFRTDTNERTKTMAPPHEKLAESLAVLQALQERRAVAVRSGDLTRTHRERLVKNGFLQEVMKGWYIPVHGDQVSPGLIERVRSGRWHPDENKDDREHRNTLAARGYWQAYQAVRESVRRVLAGENPGGVCDDDHGNWYREMFGPGVAAGLLRTADLAGYRSDPVYIRRSMHVPPRYEAVRDCMPAFFDLLKKEPEPAVRGVLGHFVFVYIHPYMDGNGRIGRFLMNVMLAAGGYPWTVIPFEKRNEYMNALESGSVGKNIAPFSDFLGRLVSETTHSNPQTFWRSFSQGREPVGPYRIVRGDLSGRLSDCHCRLKSRIVSTLSTKIPYKINALDPYEYERESIEKRPILPQGMNYKYFQEPRNVRYKPVFSGYFAPFLK